MIKKFQYIVITAIIFILITFIISSNFYRILYIRDYTRSYFIKIYETITPGKNHFTIINPEFQEKYINVYKKLPRGYYHSGFFLFYTTEDKIKIKDLSVKSIKYTDYYRISDLTRAIKKYNNIKKNTIEKNQIIVIPNSIPPLIRDFKNHKKPEIIYSRGLYFSGRSTGSLRMLKKISEFNKYNINTIVFDVKDITGIVNYHSNVRLARVYNTHKKRSIDNIHKLIRELKKNKIYSIARIAVFHDHILAKADKSLRIKSKRTGGSWNPKSKEIWCDPTNKKVQDYNIELAIELAQLGVDEIQFDYIRFPTAGKLKDAKYSYDFGKMSKEMSITNFLRRAYTEISSRNTRLSIDIFGVVAWGKNVDINKTGQRIELLYKYCDVISPMLYPSHFNDDFDGFANPGDNPYYFINRGCKKVIQQSGNKIWVRPWLQAFKWRVSNYNDKYILDQVKASYDSGAFGYLFWNASNKYKKVYRVLSKTDK